MPRMSKNVEVEFIEFICEKCNKGVFRLDVLKKPIESSPKQWPHQCTHCQCESYFTVIYPLLKYKNTEFSQLQSIN